MNIYIYLGAVLIFCVVSYRQSVVFISRHGTGSKSVCMIVGAVLLLLVEFVPVTYDYVWFRHNGVLRAFLPDPGLETLLLTFFLDDTSFSF